MDTYVIELHQVESTMINEHCMLCKDLLGRPIFAISSITSRV